MFLLEALRLFIRRLSWGRSGMKGRQRLKPA
jgi:hypothetical protein